MIVRSPAPRPPNPKPAFSSPAPEKKKRRRRKPFLPTQSRRVSTSPPASSPPPSSGCEKIGAKGSDSLVPTIKMNRPSLLSVSDSQDRRVTDRVNELCFPPAPNTVPALISLLDTDLRPCARSGALRTVISHAVAERSIPLLTALACKLESRLELNRTKSAWLCLLPVTAETATLARSMVGADDPRMPLTPGGELASLAQFRMSGAMLGYAYELRRCLSSPSGYASDLAGILDNAAAGSWEACVALGEVLLPGVEGSHPALAVTLTHDCRPNCLRADVGLLVGWGQGVSFDDVVMGMNGFCNVVEACPGREMGGGSGRLLRIR